MAKHILVIDDDPLIRRLYQHEFAQDGYDVTAVASGAEALSSVQDDTFDVAVLDIEMPDMSGLELLGKLRDSAPEMPIILNSAYTTYKSDFQCWLADAYMVKSSDLNPLKNQVKELVVARERS